MKNFKKVLGVTALAGAVLVGGGFGTYSWFTDNSEASGEIQNGTLSLGEMGTLYNHNNFAPSQILLSDWQTVENTGSLDQLLRASYTHSVDKANLSKYKVGYLAVKFKERPGPDKLKNFELRLQNGILNGHTNPAKMSTDTVEGFEVIEGVLTSEEAEKMTAAAAGGTKTFTLGDGNGFWQLKHNEYIDIIFGVKLLDSAGNEYQNAKYDATFKVEAKQTDNGSEYGPDND